MDRMYQLYDGMVNSPETELTQNIGASDTTISVKDASKLPAPPNMAVIGRNEDAETILYTGKSGNTLTGVTRGFQGQAKSWKAGAPVARRFTEYDWRAIKDNFLKYTVQNVINVKGFGAKGDGVTDDTAAIQAALDAATEGSIIYFPPATYRTTATLYLSNKNNVTIWGYGATIKNETQSKALLCVHGGVLPSRDDAGFDYLVRQAFYGQEVEGVRVLGLTGVMLPKDQDAYNLGFVMVWAKHCEFRDLAITSSNGNAFEIRCAVDCTIENCRATGFRNYGIFVFHSLRTRVLNNYIEGGHRGINLKHSYNGHLSVGHVVEGNTIVDVDDNNYYIVGGDWFENRPEYADPIYVPNHEVLADVIIQRNVLRAINSPVPPGITVGCFARNWIIRDNYFYGGDKPGFAMSIGWAGNPEDGGTIGEDHIIEGNIIERYDASDNTIFGVACSAYIRNNFVSSKCRFLVVCEASRLPSIKRLVVEENTFVVDGMLRVVGESGIVVKNVCDHLIVRRNNITITSVTNSTYDRIEAIYTAAKYSNISCNVIKVSIGPGVSTHTHTYGVVLNGQEGDVEGNNLNLDASNTVYAVYVSTGNYRIRNNIFDATSSTATTKHGIYTLVFTVELFNTFLGIWTSSTFDANANGTIRHLGARRIAYASQAPTVGSWNAGDIIINWNASAGGRIGWVCVQSGTPGTWKAFGPIDP